VCCSVLQCVAACCSVLQRVAVCGCELASSTEEEHLSWCVAVCCSLLQCVAVCCSVLQCVAVCLQCVAVCLQCVAVNCSVLQWISLHRRGGSIKIDVIDIGRNTLQHTATHCNTLQHTATHYSTLQHTFEHRRGGAIKIDAVQLAYTHAQTFFRRRAPVELRMTKVGLFNICHTSLLHEYIDLFYTST